jgi:hypothetical protein
LAEPDKYSASKEIPYLAEYYPEINCSFTSRSSPGCNRNTGGTAIIGVLAFSGDINRSPHQTRVKQGRAPPEFIRFTDETISPALNITRYLPHSQRRNQAAPADSTQHNHFLDNFFTES